MHPAPITPIVAFARAASIAAALALPAGAAAAADGDAAAGTNRCLFASQVNGFSDVADDETSIILEAGASQRFRVSLVGRCHGLDDALQIGVSTLMSCVRAGDRIIYSFAGFRRDCTIAGLEPVTNDTTRAAATP